MVGHRRDLRIANRGGRLYGHIVNGFRHRGHRHPDLGRNLHGVDGLRDIRRRGLAQFTQRHQDLGLCGLRDLDRSQLKILELPFRLRMRGSTGRKTQIHPGRHVCQHAMAEHRDRRCQRGGHDMTTADSSTLTTYPAAELYIGHSDLAFSCHSPAG